MVVRIFLGVIGAMWLGYGVWCFVNPGYLRDATGIAFISTTGNIDLRATYGGLQMAIGILLLGGALRAVAARQTLLAYGVLCAGIGSARLAGALLEAQWSTYTFFAVCFELGSVVAVLLLLAPGMRRRRA